MMALEMICTNMTGMRMGDITAMEIVERDSDLAPRYDVEPDFLFLHDLIRLLYLRQIGVMD